MPEKGREHIQKPRPTLFVILLTFFAARFLSNECSFLQYPDIACYMHARAYRPKWHRFCF